MPILDIRTNITHADSKAVLKKASTLLAELTGKPESYCLVSLALDAPVSFGGNADAPGML